MPVSFFRFNTSEKLNSARRIPNLYSGVLLVSLLVGILKVNQNLPLVLAVATPIPSSVFALIEWLVGGWCVAGRRPQTEATDRHRSQGAAVVCAAHSSPSSRVERVERVRKAIRVEVLLLLQHCFAHGR